MVLDIVVEREPDGQCRRFPTRCCPQSPRSRGGDALRQSLCMTREWMARSSMRSARRGSTAGLLAHRAARTQGKSFSSFSRKRRNKPDSEPAGAAILARRAGARKRISFDTCAAKLWATRTAHFLCGTLRNEQGLAPPTCSARSAKRWESRRGNRRSQLDCILIVRHDQIQIMSVPSRNPMVCQIPSLVSRHSRFSS